MKRIIVFTHPNQFRKADKLLAIFRYAQSNGWQVVCIEPEESPTVIERTIRAFRPDGIIYEGDGIAKMLARIRRPRTPAVFLDATVAWTSARHTVNSDADAIVKLAFSELLSARPKSGLFVSQHKGLLWSDRRREAFARECFRQNLPFAAVELTIRNPFAAQNIVEKSLSRLPRPIAVLSANDATAELVFSAAKAAGLSIPVDVQIVSVDNNALVCDNLKPTLTSIEQDMSAAGHAAAELLDKLLQDPRLHPIHRNILPRAIVRRGSSAPVTDMPYKVSRAVCFIREHALEPISVNAVVNVMGCSRRSAEMSFAKTVGKSINGMILELRFEKVLQLLANPNQRIEAIANLCGWKSSTTLMRSFRQRFGQTMNAWRKALH